MKDRLLIALFSVGTFLGFGGGLFSVAFHHGHHAQRRQAAFEHHIADVCVDAARRADRRDRDWDRRDREWDRRDRDRRHWDRRDRGYDGYDRY